MLRIKWFLRAAGELNFQDSALTSHFIETPKPHENTQAPQSEMNTLYTGGNSKINDFDKNSLIKTFICICIHHI